MKGFKQFLMRGNVIDLAVAVVIGGAFGAVVDALVKDLFTPFIAGLVGKPDFSGIAVTFGGSKILIGAFLNALVALILVAAAIYFFVVMPIVSYMLLSGFEPIGLRNIDTVYWGGFLVTVVVSVVGGGG